VDVANQCIGLRLKWAMDYWCARLVLADQAGGFIAEPDSWLLGASMNPGSIPGAGRIAKNLARETICLPTRNRCSCGGFSDRHGFVGRQKLKKKFERLAPVRHDGRIRPLALGSDFADLLAGGALI